MLAEVIRDRELLSRVRSAVDSCRIDSETDGVAFDYAKLSTDPLLQSIYAETLRLHVASFIMRSPRDKDFHHQNWHIPQDAVIMISSYHAQTDPKEWGTTGGHAVDRFWAERFLAQPEPSVSDSIDESAVQESRDSISARCNGRKKHSGSPQVSFNGCSNAWIPYGGGQRMCPGRHFAKQEMIVTLAIMLTLYDIELADVAGRIPQNDLAGFGFGTLWPKGKTPIRLRQRRSSCVAQAS